MSILAADGSYGRNRNEVGKQSTQGLILPLRFVPSPLIFVHSTMASRRKNVKKGVQFTIMVVGKQSPSLVSLLRSNFGH